MYIDPRPPNPDRSKKICDFFLKTCEEGKYGWAWRCPNGNETCLYAHALPEGHMLESTMKALQLMQREEQGDKAIEYMIEDQRAALDSNKLTPVNETTFNEWKERRKVIRDKILRKEEQKAKKTKRATGRAVFSLNPNLFVDDEGAADEDDITEENKDEEKVDFKEIVDVHEEERL